MLEFEPIEPDDTERIWEFDADLDGRIFTYQIKWVERTGSHYLTLWDSDGELVIAGQRLGLDIAAIAKYRNLERFPNTFLVLLDLDDSGAPPQFEELGHRLRFLTYELSEFPNGGIDPEYPWPYTVV
jgi:hypothetical protein